MKTVKKRNLNRKSGSIVLNNRGGCAGKKYNRNGGSKEKLFDLLVPYLNLFGMVVLIQ